MTFNFTHLRHMLKNSQTLATIYFINLLFLSLNQKENVHPPPSKLIKYTDHFLMSWPLPSNLYIDEFEGKKEAVSFPLLTQLMLSTIHL